MKGARLLTLAVALVVAGFVFTRLGYLPPSGTKLEIPRLAITVRRSGRKRIEEVLLEKTTAFEAAA